MAANCAAERELETNEPTSEDYRGATKVLSDAIAHLRETVRILEGLEGNAAVTLECEQMICDATCDADESLFQVRVALGLLSSRAL